MQRGSTQLCKQLRAEDVLANDPTRIVAPIIPVQEAISHLIAKTSISSLVPSRLSGQASYLMFKASSRQCDVSHICLFVCCCA